MRKILFSSLLILATVFNLLSAQQKSDSTTINLSDVEVNATRNKLYSEMGRILTVIDKTEISRSAVQSIDQLLDYVAGIDIRQRGVNTTQADISVRGGSFDQVLVLLNGVNITDPQTGHFNLDIPLNLSDVSRVEILEGSSARVLGPNAFSGAINIVTESSDRKALNAELTGGSYNTFGESVSGNFGNNKWHTFASMNHKSSDGYITNTDFNFTNAFVQSTLNTKNAGKFDLQLAGQLKDFGANSFYTPVYPNQFESSKTFIAALNWSLVKGNWTFNAQAYWRRHHDRFELYRDSITIKPSWYKSHNYHMTDVTGGKASASYLSKIGKTTLGVDIRNEHIYSNVLGTPIDSMRAPLEKNGFFTKEDNRLIETAMLDHTLKISNWYLSAGAAVTNSTTFGVNGFGGVDIAYEFNENVRVFGDVNSAVRLPTFNDLYYKSKDQLANPNLQPEKSQTFEVGTKIRQNNISIDAAIYYRRGQNVIDWVRIPLQIAKTAKDSLWQSKNLTNVNAMGADITLTHYFHDSFIRKITTTYSYLTMDKSADEFDSKYVLDYLKHKLVIATEYQLCKTLIATLSASYMARVATATVPATSYFLMDGKLLWTQKHYDIFATVNNIFNTTYSDYSGLIQPGINFNVGIRLKL